jgi:hypothetical protein
MRYHGRAAMLFLFTFLAGVANFAMQKAVLESGHPFVEDVRRSFGAVVGERFSLILDFVLLAMVLIFVARGNAFAAWLYFGYTGFNALDAWAILSRRL